MSTEPMDGAGEVAVTDEQLFDNAIEPTPAAPPQPPPAAEPSKAQPTAPQPETPGQPRDDQGRFAAKAALPPQPTAAAPQAPKAPPGPPPQDHRVPLRELLDERERRQRIEAENNQMRQAWAQIQAMQQQQMATQQQPPLTLYDNPEQYLLQNVVEPIRQEGRMEFLRMKDEWSREYAEQQHGPQAVQTALDDLARIRRSPQGDYVFNQIMSQRHPYGALVKWHAHAKMQQQIGPDPNAWLQKQQQAWLDDPKVQAEVVKRIQAQQQNSNRPPTVNLPPSLSSLPSGGGDEQGDLTDASLYRFATR